MVSVNYWQTNIYNNQTTYLRISLISVPMIGSCPQSMLSHPPNKLELADV